MSDAEFWKELDHVEIRAPHGSISDDAKKPAIRLYCTSADTSWCLQVRAQETLANGTAGKKYLIASATLDRETMLALRAAINANLEEYAEFREDEP